MLTLAQRARDLSLAETLGLDHPGERLREVWLAARGDEHTPPSKFGLSTVRIFQPLLSLQLWAGLVREDRRISIYNLFNHTPTPLSDGWSVRKTQVRDFRGGTLTYDSHNGTDFAVPPGTIVVAPAPARVVRISNDFNRGGLKIVLDHGDGLVTTSNHLARALVCVGERLDRGQPMALSGCSGLDFVLTLPWSAPHVHFNVWLDGVSVDPFARPGEVSLWRSHNDPTPCAAAPGEATGGALSPTRFDEVRVASALEACKPRELRARIAAIPDLDARAFELMFQMNYYPTRFACLVATCAEAHPRQPRLDLPFRACDYVGIRI